MNDQIKKLKQAIEVNFAWTNKKKMIASLDFERFSTTGLEFFVGKAIEMGMGEDLTSVFNIDSNRIRHLNESYIETLKNKRYKIKSKLIDNYLRLN